jgi:hypothetical protein
LLATWQYELGRTAALPIDFQSGAATWPAWPGFAKLWSQLAVWAAPAALASDRRLEAQRLREGTLVELETGRDSPGPFVLRIPDSGDVPLRRTGRRTFSAIVPNLRPGLQPVRLVSGEGVTPAEQAIDLFVPASSTSGREYRRNGPNLALLEQVAALTGGAVAPEPAALFAARAGIKRHTIPLAGVLIPLALGFLLGDIACRRLGHL